jgi:hypothetical protein
MAHPHPSRLWAAAVLALLSRALLLAGNFDSTKCRCASAGIESWYPNSLLCFVHLAVLPIAFVASMCARTTSGPVVWVPSSDATTAHIHIAGSALGRLRCLWAWPNTSEVMRAWYRGILLRLSRLLGLRAHLAERRMKGVA